MSETAENNDNPLHEIRKVFRLHPELRTIGSEKQYQEYLQKIYPESAVRDIVWHGSPSDRFEKFDDEKIGRLDSGYYGVGFSFSGNHRLANRYRIRHRGVLPKERIGTGSMFAECAEAISMEKQLYVLHARP